MARMVIEVFASKQCCRLTPWLWVPWWKWLLNFLGLRRIVGRCPNCSAIRSDWS